MSSLLKLLVFLPAVTMTHATPAPVQLLEPYVLNNGGVATSLDTASITTGSGYFTVEVCDAGGNNCGGSLGW